MLSALLLPLLPLLALPASIAAHGNLVNVKPIGSFQTGATRGYNKAGTDISSLRNPVEGEGVCRGLPPGKPVEISLVNGQDMTITLAFSLNANHIGPCWVEIMDPQGRGGPWTIAHVEGPLGCARRPVGRYDVLPGGRASEICPGLVPPIVKDVSDDMCMSEWTFKVTNADQITCTTCVLRWRWWGEHISATDPEKYENCIDVNIVNASGQQQQQQAPGPKGSPEKPSKTTKASKTTNKPPKTSSKPSRTSKKPKPTTRKRFRTTTSAANLVDPTPQSTPTPDGETPCIETPSSSPTPGGNDTGGDGNLAGSSNCYDNASKSGKSGLNFACASKSSRRFYACYPENPLRAPQIQKCPNGTTCKQHGKWIACRP